MKKKLLGIFVCMLLIATALPAVGTTNIEKADSISLNPNVASTGTIVWSDDFDSYTAGSLLHGQGGWEAWDLTIELSPYVSNEKYRSSPNSVEIDYDDEGIIWSDIIHMFYGVNSDQWTITAWWFLPEEFVGVSNFVLHNKYEHGVHEFPRDTSVVLQADGQFDVIDDLHTLENLPLIRGEWIEIRIEIDFDLDTYDAYYNSTLLSSASWTRGEGQKNLACINLCNDGEVSNVTYFDDINIEGDVSENSDLYCEGDLGWQEVEPGATVVGSFILQNSGIEGTLLDWEIESTPDWGEWSFDPNGGTDLESWSPITVNVEVVAPNEKDKFTGELKIVNSENSDDYEIIDITLSTPRNKPFNFNFPLLSWLFERFPHAFPILRQLLEL